MGPLYPALCPRRNGHYCAHLWMKKPKLRRPHVACGGAYRIILCLDMGLEPFCALFSAAASQEEAESPALTSISHVTSSKLLNLSGPWVNE